MGYLRRSEPARGYGQPLEANAVVLEHDGERVVVVGVDIAAIVGVWGQRVRAEIARACDCPVAHVLVNAQHTHAAPPVPGWMKAGGDYEWNERERRYADSLPDLLASVAGAAAEALAPARIGAARTTVEGISVNRRQRHEGGTILGWNPDEICDRDVAVVRVDRAEGGAIATLVAFACHPVVVGPDVPEISSDFVGGLRARVRAWTGGECIFLQCCAGNILPFEAFWDRPGPELRFADRLAAAALGAWAAAPLEPTRPEQVPFASAVPMAIWRHVPSGEPVDHTIRAVEREVSLPLQALPTAGQMHELQGELRSRADALQAEGAARTAWNPVLLHSHWAGEMAAALEAGLPGTVLAPVQAIRIGGICLTAWPCEPFCELGLEVRERSQAPFPITLGYSNDLVGYVATRREYPFGGYEPTVSHRHFGRPVPFAEETGELLVAQALELTAQVFAS